VGREICQLWWLEAVGLAEAARNGYKEKTFLNSTRPSDSMAWFDSEILEAQLASSSACAVNLSMAGSQSFTDPWRGFSCN